MRSKQTGFSHVESLLVLLIIGVIGFSGWLVYQQQHKNAAVTTNTAQHTISQPAATPYLDIKEWRVKLPLSTSIKDAYYVAGVGSVGTDGVTNQIYLGLKSLDASGCTADGDNHGQTSALGLIFRTRPDDTDPVTGKTYPQLYPDGITAGGYFYGFEGFNSTNVSTCKAPQASIQSADSAFATAAKGIVIN